MNILFHRGYVGFQYGNNDIQDHSIRYNQDFNIDNFISAGIFDVPVTDPMLPDELGNNAAGYVSPNYEASRSFHLRKLYWTNKLGPRDIIYRKQKSDGPVPEKRHTYRSIPIDTIFAKSYVMCGLNTDNAALIALVHADATFSQIDSYMKEFNMGNSKPFVWLTFESVLAKIDASVDTIRTKFGTTDIIPIDQPSRHIYTPEEISDKE